MWWLRYSRQRLLGLSRSPRNRTDQLAQFDSRWPAAGRLAALVCAARRALARGWFRPVDEARRLHGSRLLHPSAGRRSSPSSVLGAPQMEVSVPAEFLSIADDRRRQESGCVFAGSQQPNAIRIRIVRPESGPSVGLSARHVPERHPKDAKYHGQHDDQREHLPMLGAPPTGFKPPRPRSLIGEPPTAAIHTVALSRFIDLSHPVVAGMETYRPLPVPRAEILNDYDASRYDGKSEFLIASLHLCGNTGTLASLESGGGRLHAVPIAWVGGATFPVRAYVVVDP